jgi:hypothetical protein
LVHLHRQGVKSLDEKPNSGKDAANTKPSRLTEIRQIIEEYANASTERANAMAKMS